MSKEKGVPSESSNQKLETTTLANQNLNETAPPPDYYKKNGYYKKGQKLTSVGKAVERREHCWQESKLVQHYRK